tara:strand:- start:847 stop:1464 length:618 start_codon:yes stop_codon:yes gene_type:complete
LRLNKTFIILLFFSFVYTQEAGFFHSKKKSSIIISTSFINQYEGAQFNDDIDFSAKLDFKFKSPLQFWLKGLYDQKEDVSFGVIGLGYLWKTKKWNLSIYSEKTFLESDLENFSNSKQNFYFNTGFIFYFKNDIPLYLKYSNIYKDTFNSSGEDEFDKVDMLMFGSYFKMNKLIYSFGLDFNLKEFLHLNLDNTEFSFTVGYKIL